jgi:hypothetical protein
VQLTTTRHRYLLGCCYTGRKEYRKAFRALEHALAINAHEPTYW